MRVLFVLKFGQSHCFRVRLKSRAIHTPVRALELTRPALLNVSG